MLTLAAFGHVVHPSLRLLLSHWLDVRAGRPMPTRRDIDATRIAPVLSSIWLCDFDPQARELRYRLSGEDLNAVYGFPLRGRELGSIFPEAHRARAVRRTLQVVEERMVLHSVGTVATTTGRGVVGERLILPLADDGGAASGVIGATIFDLSDDRPIAGLKQDVQLTMTPVSGAPGPAPVRTTVALPWDRPNRSGR